MKSDSWLSAVSPAIEVLDERQLMLVELSYRHGLTHHAIAAQLETARSVISSEIATALRALALALEAPRRVIAIAVPDVA